MNAATIWLKDKATQADVFLHPAKVDMKLAERIHQELQKGIYDNVADPQVLLLEMAERFANEQ